MNHEYTNQMNGAIVRLNELVRCLYPKEYKEGFRMTSSFKNPKEARLYLNELKEKGIEAKIGLKGTVRWVLSRIGVSYLIENDRFAILEKN